MVGTVELGSLANPSDHPRVLGSGGSFVHLPIPAGKTRSLPIRPAGCEQKKHSSERWHGTSPIRGFSLWHMTAKGAIATNGEPRVSAAPELEFESEGRRQRMRVSDIATQGERERAKGVGHRCSRLGLALCASGRGLKPVRVCARFICRGRVLRGERATLAGYGGTYPGLKSERRLGRADGSRQSTQTDLVREPGEDCTGVARPSEEEK